MQHRGVGASLMRGFTLAELLVAVAVLGILLTLAAPDLRAMIRNNRLATLSNQLVVSLQYARTEAVKRGASVSVCKTADASAQNPVCVSNGGWEHGWLVFVDGGAAGVIDGADLRLQVAQADSGGASITGDAALVNFLGFNARGAALNGAGGTIALCLDGLRRDVTINATGHVKVAQGSC